MMIWGGSSTSSPYLNTDGRYCACPYGQNLSLFRDADGDGYGTGASMSVPSCDGTIPPGYSATSGDCNDADPSAHALPSEVDNSVRLEGTGGSVTITWTSAAGTNSCGNGSYGFAEVHGVPTTPRVSTACP